MAILFISHRIEEVFEIADRVTILRDGRWISTTPRAELTPATAISRMVGREVRELFRRERREPGAVRLSVADLRREGAFQDVSFDLRAGEVLGFAGLVGARRTDVGLALFGIAPADGGEIELDGTPVTVTNPRDAMALGHRLQHRGPPAARSRHAALDRGEHLAALAAPLPVAERDGAPRGRAGDRRDIPATAEHPRAVGRYAGLVALRRQPAEGRHQQVAGDEPAR